MSSLGSPSPFFLAGKKAYEVKRSLRFNPSDNANLTRTSSSASTTFTYSAWIKRSTFTGYQYIFSIGNRGFAFHTSTNSFYLYDGTLLNGSTAVFRDPSAWYHIVVQVNSGTATSYINNVLVHNGVGSGAFTLTTGSNETRMGVYNSNDYDFSGYMAEVNLVDGSVLAPSSFAETDAITGQWNPKKYIGSYGTNGFYLNFSDNSGTTATTLGKDSSGNGNNFTPNNFVTGDSVKDTPTNNFATWSPISTRSLPTLSEGNLKNASNNNSACASTFGVTSGKWYWEIHILTDISTTSYIAATGVTAYQTELEGDSVPRLNYDTSKRSWYRAVNTSGAYSYKNYTDTNGTDVNSGGTFYGGTVISFRLDMDNGTLKYYTNNTLVHTDSTIPTDGTVIFPMQNATNSGTTRHNSSIINFGQDGTFAGNKTAQGNADENGIGNFFYAVPSGHKAMCSANLPDPTILLPNKHFDTLLYTGNGGTQSITGLEYQPDWVWIKERTGSYHGSITDSVRGVLKTISSSRVDITEKDESNGLNQLLSNGLGFNGVGFYYVNRNSQDYVAWNWNAGDTDGKTYTVTVVNSGGNKYRFDGFGTNAVTLALAEGGTYIFDQSDSSNAGHPLRFSTTSNGTHGGGSEYTTGVTTAGTPGQSGAYTQIVVAASAPTLYYYCTQHSGMGGQVDTFDTLGSSNFDGSVQSVVKANTTAGFSIVRWTIPSDAVYTVGHGLGVAPQVIFMKARNQTTNWDVFHVSIGNTKRIKLNSSDAPETQSGVWNNTNPTSTVFTNTGSWLNGSGTNVVAYVFSEVAGYSKFGSYTGYGETNGVFVYTGFRPAWLIVKKTSTANSWVIYDTKTSPLNVIDKYLIAEGADQENTNSAVAVDLLSNGFKFRTPYDIVNAGDYIYFAFAESPFKNARAR